MLKQIDNRLRRSSLLWQLHDIKKTCPDSSTVYLPPELSGNDIDSMIADVIKNSPVPENLSKTISKSATGALLIWGDRCKYLVIPPFPITERLITRTCEPGKLCTLLEHDFYIALVIIRLGAYAIGVFKGDDLVSGKVGTGLVHARHRQGGSSSHRFERHREKQMETFFTRVCGHYREQLEPYNRQLDYVIYGGTRETILDFRKQCHYTQQFDKMTLQSLLNVREPKQSTLKDAIQEAYSSQVAQWTEE